MNQTKSAIELYVGGHAGTLPGLNPGEREPENLSGKRMFTAAHCPNKADYNQATLEGIVDSGAFSDPLEKRLGPERALERQVAWERRASEKWGFDFRAYAFVSYDLLIDETWVFGERHKRRWSIKKGEWAVSQTIEAATYLASRREELGPRRLVLSCQGVDAIQYSECADELLKVASPNDIFGLGGWCILGQRTSLLPEFWRTIHSVLPVVKRAGLTDVHIFGVLYRPALGGLLHLADGLGLKISTDSTAPVLACTYKDKSRSGVIAESGYWRDNVEMWQRILAEIRDSKYYKPAPRLVAGRQTTLLEFEENLEVG
jgi:hypothetical protein